MYEYEFNNLLKTVSNSLFEYNQIVYQIVIFVTLYLFFYKLNDYYYNSHNPHNPHKKNIKSFITLALIIAIIIDWFIWLNFTNTFLFSALLLIYVSYNFKQLDLITELLHTV